MERGSGRTQEPPTHGQGGPIFTASQDVKGTGRDPAQEPGSGIRVPTPCQGAALLWHSAIEYPGGTVMVDWKRGGLMGAIPKALCGEAPKGQPMIRRENLEAVRVEAPKGQPRKHRPRTNRAVRRPMGEEPEKRRR